MRSDAKDFAQDTDPKFGRFAGMLRRMTVTVHAKPLWQVTGFRQPDDKQPETRQAEPFTGIGFFARPPSSGKPEAVVGFVGGDRNPIVIATRDEATRAVMAGSLQPDETMIFTSTACVHIKADGSIEIRSKNGTAKKLVTMDDFDALITDILPNVGAGAATAVPVTLANYRLAHPTWPVGTTKLKGE